VSGVRRAAVTRASLVLEHVPDLVRYGSKPSREPAKIDALQAALRPFEEAVAYAPNQVFVGNLPPEDLWERPRTWWQHPVEGASAHGTTGDILPQPAFYELLAEVDGFGLVQATTDPGPGTLALYDGDKVVGTLVGDHDLDESLSAHVLLENLAIKASGVHALRDLLARSGIDPASITHAIGCGEEAVGDRYQRGGGNMAKAIAEEGGLARASALDVKSFCAAPVHALVIAAALIEAGIEQRVVVVSGGSLAKLGMKFEGALAKGFPILEDVLAGMAVAGPIRKPGDDGGGRFHHDLRLELGGLIEQGHQDQLAEIDGKRGAVGDPINLGRESGLAAHHRNIGGGGAGFGQKRGSWRGDTDGFEYHAFAQVHESSPGGKTAAGYGGKINSPIIPRKHHLLSQGDGALKDDSSPGIRQRQGGLFSYG